MGLSKYSFQHTRGDNLQEKGDRNWQKDFIPLIADKLYVTKILRSFLNYIIGTICFVLEGFFCKSLTVLLSQLCVVLTTMFTMLQFL